MKDISRVLTKKKIKKNKGLAGTTDAQCLGPSPHIKRFSALVLIPHSLLGNADCIFRLSGHIKVNCATPDYTPLTDFCLNVFFILAGSEITTRQEPKCHSDLSVGDESVRVAATLTATFFFFTAHIQQKYLH